jgi:hypothetical protein
MALPNNDAPTLAQRIKLTDALRRKMDALDSANLCLTSTSEPDLGQSSRNANESAAISAKLPGIGSGPINYPGDDAVSTLGASADALKTASTACKTALDNTTNPAARAQLKAPIIAGSQALIPIVRASSV